MSLVNRLVEVAKRYGSGPTSETNWLSTIEKSYPNGLDRPGLFLPSFPDQIIQDNTVGCHGRMAIHQAHTFYVNALAGLARDKRPDNTKKVLDFGVGWGRIARFFIRDVGIHNVYGVDVEKSFVEICRNSFRTENFSVINPLPPMPFNSETFDLITLYSVFSHLSEEACRKWVSDFHRILKPGGSVAFTTRSIHFFDYCEGKLDAPTAYERSLGKLFENFNEAKERYLKGEFVFSGVEGVGGGGAMNTSYYGESFIPEEYVASVFCGPNLFKSYKRIAPTGMVDQETFVLFKE